MIVRLSREKRPYLDAAREIPLKTLSKLWDRGTAP